MALVACTGCGHSISSFARFCPKCNYPKNDRSAEAPPPNNHFVFPSETAEVPEQQSGAFTEVSFLNELLLQHEFKPAMDEIIVLKGRTFIASGFFNIAEGYAYLTSKRYVVCDSSAITINFQTPLSNIAAVEERRHLISNKIVITTTSGEMYQVKGLPHAPWFNALHDVAVTGGTTLKPVQNSPGGATSSVDWHYESDGIKIGPVKEQQIIQLIKNNHTVFRTSKVWNPSFHDWKRAEDTILTIYFNDSVETMPGRSDATGHSGNNFLSRISLLCRKYL